MDDKELIKNLDELKKDDLASVEKASDYVLQTLVASQHSNLSQKTITINKSSAFGEHVSEDLDYILKRIITGCLDTSPHVQLNFTIPLIQVLNKFQTEISLKHFLKYVNDVTNRQNAVSKTETNHFIVGQIYCVLGVAKSGMLQQTHQEETETILLLLFTELTRTPWLDDIVVEVLRHLFANITQQSLLQVVLKQMNSRLKDTLQDNTLQAVRTLFVLREGYKKAALNEFPYQKNLQEKVFNHKNLKLALQTAVDKFPIENPGLKDVIFYMYDVSRTAQRKFEIWVEFWNFITKEFTFAQDANQQNIFVTLCLMKRLLKMEDFKFEELQYIFNEDLVQLWLQNLSVMNKDIKLIATQIEQQIVEIIQKKINKQSQTDRQTLFEFVKLTQLRPNYRFSVKNSFANTIYTALNKEQLQELFKYLKQRLLASHNEQQRYFLINEIYVLAEIEFKSMEESEFLDIIFLLFEEMNETQLAQLYEQLNEEVQEQKSIETFIEQNQEIIISYLQSLLALCCQSSNEAFQTQQSNVWKGRCANFESWLFRIMNEIKQKADYFKENVELSETIKSISHQLDFTDNLEKEIQQNLKLFLNQTEKDKQFNKKLKREMAISNLYLGLCFTSLFFPEENLEILDEIQMIHKEIQNQQNLQNLKEGTTKKRKLNNQKEKAVAENGVNAVPEKYIHALTDLLIALLSKSTGFLRDLVNIAFEAYVEEIDEFSLSILTSVITKNNEEFLQDEPNGEAQNESDLEDEEDKLVQQEEENL